MIEEKVGIPDLKIVIKLDFSFVVLITPKVSYLLSINSSIF